MACAADDDEWVAIARHATGSELDRIVAAVRASLDRDENHDARRAFERRRAERFTRDDGLAEIRIVAPRDVVDTVWAAVETEVGRLVDDAVGGSDRTRREIIDERGGLAALRCDGVARLAEQAIASRPAAATRGDIGRLQLTVDTDFLAAVAEGDDVVDAECTLGGSRIAPDVALRWSCDIRSSVVLAHSGHACDEGRDSRTPNRRLRRALRRRDRGMCRFPGCGATAWLHAHHIVHWARGGPTDLDNLVSLCGFHHHLVHEGGWSVSLVDNAVVWSDPDGVPATVEPLSGDAPEVAAAGVPAGTIEAQWHNDRLDFGFVVSVIAGRCGRIRRRPRGDVSPGASPAAVRKCGT